MTQKVKTLVDAFLKNPKLATKSVKDIQERHAAGRGYTREEIIEAKAEANRLFQSNFGGQKEAIEAVRKLREKGEDHDWNRREAEFADAYKGLEDRVTSYQEDLENGTGQFTAKLNSEVTTLEELIARCKIDTEKWEITKYVQNYWGNDNYPCFQVKAFMKARTAKESDLIEKLLNDFEPNYKPLAKKDLLVARSGRPKMQLISLADFHLDKLVLSGETIEDKQEIYRAVINNLLTRAERNHYIEEILYITSNDFFHTDTYSGTTTKGTKLDVEAQWYEAYEIGFRLQVETIMKLKQFSEKVHVMHIPSNHAHTKEYFLIHALEVYFKNDTGVTFDRTAEKAKIYSYGDCLIGASHGDSNMSKLPLYFASKFKKAWGAAKHIEIALADKHHRKEWKFSLSQEEVEGVRMFIAPSLSDIDLWHKNEFYDLAIRAAISRIYDKENGYMEELEERI